MTDHHQQLATIYAAFNRREVDILLGHLHPDVEWPNGWEGGWVHGRDAVREYWQRQWHVIDPHVEPTGFEDEGTDVVRVAVHQTVCDLAGAVLFDGTVTHVYEFEGDVVRRMTILDRTPSHD